MTSEGKVRVRSVERGRTQPAWAAPPAQPATATTPTKAQVTQLPPNKLETVSAGGRNEIVTAEVL